jgi:hydrogenase maturation protease
MLGGYLGKRTLVLGLGNPILSDDSVGVHVARAVQALLPAEAGIDVQEASLGGLTLMESMFGYTRVILIDAIRVPDFQPGEVRRLTLDDLETLTPTQHSASPHDASLPTAIAAGRQLGLPLPEEIIIFAIQVENVTDFGEQMTPAVAAAVPKVVEAVLEEIQRLNN